MHSKYVFYIKYFLQISLIYAALFSENGLNAAVNSNKYLLYERNHNLYSETYNLNIQEPKGEVSENAEIKYPDLEANNKKNWDDENHLQNPTCECENGHCIKEKGKEICKCPPGFGNFTTTKCKACECGLGIIENTPNICFWNYPGGLGRKVCLCRPGFAVKYEACVDCECGPDSNCTFVKNDSGWLSFFSKWEKICQCKPGYHDKNGKCIGPCTKNPCKNGGTCKESANGYECVCRVQFTGENCTEKATPCSSNPCQNGGTCTVSEESFICECLNPYSGPTCEATCSCGLHGTCTFVNGQKKCNCVPGFTEKNGTCTDCVCRGGTCVLEAGKEVCKCPPGYGNFTNALCKACDCGPDTNCIWEAGFAGRKVCQCKPGYSTKKGICVACDCGPDSSCEWINEGWLKPERKVCYCKPGYQEEKGKCVGVETFTTIDITELPTSRSSTIQDCDCGSFSSSCSLDSEGNKICSCFMGYSQIYGSCKECNCGPHGTCSFENRVKKCSCKSFATEMNGNCIDKQDLESFCKLP